MSGWAECPFLSVLWLIDGTLHSDPSLELLSSMAPYRDFVVTKPLRSKADQDGTKFGALPIYLSFDPSDRANAAHWLQRLELQFPCHAQERQARPLFCEDAKTFRPMSHGTVDRYLGLLLRSLLPEAEPVKYSFHSSRVGFASAPLAAGCPPATIQAFARWSSCSAPTPSPRAAFPRCRLSTSSTSSPLLRRRNGPSRASKDAKGPRGTYRDPRSPSA